MTEKTVRSIEMADIQAVEFECKACRAKLSIPAGAYKVPPLHCASCDSEQQWVVPGGQDQRDFVHLGEVIQRMRDFAPRPFAVRLILNDASREGA